MEEKYLDAVKLFHAADCMVACRDKILIYRKALARFKSIEEYKDSKSYCRQCRARAKQTRIDIKEAAYKTALNQKIKANTARDYIQAEESFRNLDDYKDSQAMAEECLQLRNNLEKKSIRGNVMRIVIAICVIVLLIGCTTTPVKYLRARAYKKVGMYNMAIKLYTKLDTYKDSESRLAECQYFYGLQLKEDEKYDEALKAFAAANSFEDSDAQKLAIEKKLIENSQPGETVNVGGASWKILKKDEDAALLIKSNKFSDITFHDTLENVTWETSSIREWLNTDFMDTFSEEEKNNILLSNIQMDDNEMYGIDGGNDTEDFIFLLSSSEAEEYAEYLGDCKVLSWLRSPGSSTNTASFLSDENIVMEYGYLVNSTGFTARPVMWFAYA